MGASGTAQGREIETTCPLDCPDTCRLEVVVENDRVTGLGGVLDDPVTAGFICAKVRQFHRRVYHADRLLFPLRRIGAKGDGEFERIAWDDAIGIITARLTAIRDEWGGEAILPYHYGGSNGLLTDGFVDAAFFDELGASRLAKTICAAPATAVAEAMYGLMPGVALQDYPAAKCIVVWGANPKSSSIHHVPFLREAKRRGAFVAVVDPRRNFSEGEIDLHLPVRPGADLPLALGLIRWWNASGLLDRQFLREHADGVDVLLEQADRWPLDRVSAATGVTENSIERLAARYAESIPAVIRCGWGVERNRNGGQAIAAILAIPAVMGKFGLPGGGYTLSNNGAARVRLDGIRNRSGSDTRSINMTQMGRVLTEPLRPPIKALFVYNCNPVVTVPDQRAVLEGLSRDDLFTVVFDQVHTDTVAFADIVLPATTFLEHHDLRIGYGHYVLGAVRPVIAPEGEARPNPEVFRALGQAMGWTDGVFSWDPAEYVARVAGEVTLGAQPVSAAELNRGRSISYDFPGATPTQFETVLPQTPDGRIHLAPPVLGDRAFGYDPVTSERHPLALISPATSRLVSSTLGEFNLEVQTLTMHPDDAAARGIGDGDEVRVFNDLGEVRCPVRIDTMIRTGVVMLPKGAWRKSSCNGWTSTALCPADINVVGGGACFNDARVQVEPA